VYVLAMDTGQESGTAQSGSGAPYRVAAGHPPVIAVELSYSMRHKHTAGLRPNELTATASRKRGADSQSPAEIKKQRVRSLLRSPRRARPLQRGRIPNLAGSFDAEVSEPVGWLSPGRRSVGEQVQNPPRQRIHPASVVVTSLKLEVVHPVPSRFEHVPEVSN
jgi:hypothetical protein